MGDIDAKTLLGGSMIFTEFKGALSEQYVLQQLKSTDKHMINYWSADRSTAEVDFVIQNKGLAVPVEVKAEENLQSKSLKVYREKFKPEIVLRISMSDFRQQDWLTNIPLYAVNLVKQIDDLIQQQ